MRTLGAPNFVIASCSRSLPPATGGESSIAVHFRADPPTAECGQPGWYGSGFAERIPVLRRKNVRGPDASRRVRRLSKAPLGGTLGRAGSSDQSTVAQPDSGCSDVHVCLGRPASRRLIVSLNGPLPRTPGGSVRTATSTWWNPGSPKAFAAERRNSPRTSTRGVPDHADDVSAMEKSSAAKTGTAS